MKYTDDPFSNRVRCDHPDIATQRDAHTIAQEMVSCATQKGRGRVVLLTEQSNQPWFSQHGFSLEATIPGFYQGHEPCSILGLYPDQNRRSLTDQDLVQSIRKLAVAQTTQPIHTTTETRLASVDDAPRIAALLDEVFVHYPTPSNDPFYVATQIRQGIPFRVVELDGEIIACASADLVEDAQTAELTDCATQRDHRGHGWMRKLLAALMNDLRSMNYKTAFTMARATTPGINIIFSRLGFSFQGTMPKSCKIGSGIEDMNVWSRFL